MSISFAGFGAAGPSGFLYLPVFRYPLWVRPNCFSAAVISSAVNSRSWMGGGTPSLACFCANSCTFWRSSDHCNPLVEYSLVVPVAAASVGAAGGAAGGATGGAAGAASAKVAGFSFFAFAAFSLLFSSRLIRSDMALDSSRADFALARSSAVRCARRYISERAPVAICLSGLLTPLSFLSASLIIAADAASTSGVSSFAARFSSMASAASFLAAYRLSLNVTKLRAL